MSLAKRALEMSSRNPHKQQIEEFLSGKIQEEKPKLLSIKKGDKVKLKTGLKGQIIKYSSNVDITISVIEEFELNNSNQVFYLTKLNKFEVGYTLKITKEEIEELIPIFNLNEAINITKGNI